MDALITATAALIGAFGGVLLARFWKTNDERRARRREWSESVLAFLDSMEAIHPPYPRPDEVPAVTHAFEIEEPTAVGVRDWLVIRAYRASRLRQRARKDVQPIGDSGYSIDFSAAFEFNRETRAIFARWARGRRIPTSHWYAKDRRRVDQLPDPFSRNTDQS